MKKETRLLVKCPECNAILETDIKTDFASFCASELQNTKAQCKNCETDFTWDKDDVLAISFC